jgi:hypothetical protein
MGIPIRNFNIYDQILIKVCNTFKKVGSNLIVFTGDSSCLPISYHIYS